MRGQVSLLFLGHERRAAEDGARGCSVQFNSIWRVHHGLLLDGLEWPALEQRDPRGRGANVAKERENCGQPASE